MILSHFVEKIINNSVYFISTKSKCNIIYNFLKLAKKLIDFMTNKWYYITKINVEFCPVLPYGLIIGRRGILNVIILFKFNRDPRRQI